jgi:hypothetical protein
MGKNEEYDACGELRGRELSNMPEGNYTGRGINEGKENYGLL